MKEVQLAAISWPHSYQLGSESSSEGTTCLLQAYWNCMCSNCFSSIYIKGVPVRPEAGLEGPRASLWAIWDLAPHAVEAMESLQ